MENTIRINNEADTVMIDLDLTRLLDDSPFKIEVGQILSGAPVNTLVSYFEFAVKILPDLV